MNPYNGYDGKQRLRAQKWLNEQWSSGQLARPSKCHACGTTAGIIQAHAEDYSEPFAAGKTDAFHLCRRCHLALHMRFRSPQAWNRYQDATPGVRAFMRDVVKI